VKETSLDYFEDTSSLFSLLSKKKN